MVFVDVYSVPPLICSGLFALVPECWPTYDCSRLFSVPTSIVPAHRSNLVKSRRAPELIICIAVSEFCVCSPGVVLLSALVGGPIGFSHGFTGVEDIAARGYLFPYMRVYITFYGFSDFFGLC